MAVCWPLKSVCVMVAPTLRGGLVPWISVRTMVVGEPPAVVFVSLYW